MDTKRLFLVTTISLVTVLLAVAGHAEARMVKIRFLLDGKSKASPRQIEFYDSLGRAIARTGIKDGAFDVPAMGPAESVDMRIHFARKYLVFYGIHASKFEGSWTVGIDHPPFDEENATSVPKGSKPRELWFIKFDPVGGDGTRMVVLGR